MLRISSLQRCRQCLMAVRRLATLQDEGGEQGTLSYQYHVVCSLCLQQSNLTPLRSRSVRERLPLLRLRRPQSSDESQVTIRAKVRWLKFKMRGSAVRTCGRAHVHSRMAIAAFSSTAGRRTGPPGLTEAHKDRKLSSPCDGAAFCLSCARRDLWPRSRPFKNDYCRLFLDGRSPHRAPWPN